MREIEFRIRDRDKWYYGVPLSKIKNDTVAFQSYDGNYYDLFADATTLGQYTGLKDKNGKKIFEGDILKCFYSSIENTGFYENLEVYYEDGGFYAGYKGLEDIYGVSVNSEVIGNIFDNPELLKGK